MKTGKRVISGGTLQNKQLAIGNWQLAKPETIWSAITVNATRTEESDAR
jgi:hypothetical protein